MTLFGRDSLITAWMALLVDPDLALGTLQTLARFQGREVDPHNEEEPGRILHEMRFGEASSLSLGGGTIYYGTADATPLFVMLLGELRRWGLAREAVDELLPHADRAIEWIENFGDRDGDGYVEYQRTSDRGLRNQGWKDSVDAVRFADGRLADPPIALAEVQGYTYGAYLARAFFAAEQGDAGRSAELRARAAALKADFNRDFWLEDKGWLAMGLDRDKRPIDALTSNMGHCLWTGILDADKADAVAEQLLGPDLFSGWGVRTLAASMVGYNPISYHCGSVWPHDNAIVAAGLMRYGYVRGGTAGDHGDPRRRRGARAAGCRSCSAGWSAWSCPWWCRYPTSVLAAGLGGRLAAADAAHPAAPRPVGAPGQGLAAPGPARADRAPARGPHPPRRAPGCRSTVEGDKVAVDGLPDDLELVDAPRHPLTGR